MLYKTISYGMIALIVLWGIIMILSYNKQQLQICKKVKLWWSNKKQIKNEKK